MPHGFLCGISKGAKTMSQTPVALNIIPFDLATASEKQWQDLVLLQGLEFNESHPDEPSSSDEQKRKEITASILNPYGDYRFFLAYNAEEKAIATLHLFYHNANEDAYESKKHIIWFNLYVQPDYRRQGIGTALMRYGLNICTEKQFTVIQARTLFRVAAPFAAYLGASEAQRSIRNRCYLAEVDWDLVQTWYERGKAANPTTELVFYDGLPQLDYQAPFADLFSHVVGEIPAGSIEGRAGKLTVERIVKGFEQLTTMGMQRMGFLALESDGQFTGMSDIIYHAEAAHKVDIGVTGVRVSQQNRGLGKWLKAAMMLYIRQNYPNVRYLDTGNADNNAPMLHINRQLGFKLHQERVSYKVSYETLLERLGL